MASAPQETIIDALAITVDTERLPSTDSEIAFSDMHEYEGFSLHVVNTLNVAVTIKAYGNVSKSETNGVAFANGSFSVAAGTTDVRTFMAAGVGWLPWVYASAQAASAPASGAVTVKIVKFKRMRP